MAHTRSFSLISLLFSAAALLSVACSSSSTPDSGNSCVADDTVTGCVSGTVGYSCQDGDTPDSSLNCSDDQGTGTFCCAVDVGVGGSAGAAGSSGGDDCVFDPTVDSQCTGTSAGYSCTGSAIPSDSDSSLNCSDDVGTGEFCCDSTVAGATCTVDDSVSCSDGDGYSCTGSDTPDQDFDGITCSVDGGGGTYCCVVGDTSGAGGSSSGGGSCVFDPTVDAQCTGTSAGYSCTDSDSPSDSDSSLNCSDDVGTGEFCCDNSSATCSVDDSVSCSDGDGYSCTGSDTPDQDYSGITCSADQGTGTFCCTPNLESPQGPRTSGSAPA